MVVEHGWDRGYRHPGAGLVARGFPCVKMHRCYRPIAMIFRQTSAFNTYKIQEDLKIDQRYTTGRFRFCAFFSQPYGIIF